LKQKPPRKDTHKNTHNHYKKPQPIKQQPLFCSINQDAGSVLQNFDTILQSVKPLSSKQQQYLPQTIKDLSHQLTDQRSSRRLSYMNQTELLTAYTHYFMWWNLVRLSHLFAGLPADGFSSLKDGDYCLDLGSGPLTLPIALWLSRPELREKKLTFYCVDLSATALTLGEEIFLSVVASINRKSEKAIEPWNIIRIKGNTETKLKHDVSAVFCANMFNELFWNSTNPLEADAKRYATTLSHFSQKEALLMVIEPGIPRAAQFISLIRDNFIRSNYTIISPCPHEKTCPMNGQRGQKWCHFVLSTENAPKKLQKLSDSAGLSKDRATLSFVLATQTKTIPTLNSIENNTNTSTYIRVVSDPVQIPGKGIGRYACSPWGLTLVMEPPASNSGNLIEASLTTEQVYHLPIDKKTGAKVLYLE
jgi:ribosomal protein RSM22 (predicted rRNA methylase)